MATAAATTTLGYYDGSDFITVAEITSLNGPSLEVPAVATSHLGTTKKSYRAGVPDAGEVSGTLWFDPANATHSALFDLWDNPVTESWKITTADSYEYAFDGILTAFTMAFSDLDENATADFTIKITGGVTETAP